MTRSRVISEIFLLFCAALLLAIVSTVNAAVAQTTQVTVTADPLWTDTAITLPKGEAVTISATGLWNYAFGNVGPDGDPHYFSGYWDEFGFFDIVDHGRLIGFIGADPYQGQWGNGSFFPRTADYLSIGSGQTFKAPFTGELWLGINDDAATKGTGDNSGQLTATITVGGSDVTGPKIKIVTPTKVYAVNEKVTAKYSCTDPDDAVATCNGPVANGAPVDTSNAGPQAFTVVATDSHGNTSTSTVVFLVASVGLAPESVAYKPQKVGTTSMAQKVGLYNRQATAISISSIGTNGDFVVTATTCGSSLGARHSCMINVAFLPTASGSRPGSLNVNDDAGTQSILLVGNGK